MSDKPQPDRPPYDRYADEAKGFKLGPPPETAGPESGTPAGDETSSPRPPSKAARPRPTATPED